MTEKRARTSTGANGRVGGRDSAGTGRGAGARRPLFTRRMNWSTSGLRGWKSTTKSSSWSLPTSITRVFARSHRYWLWSTIVWRMSASSSGTRCVYSMMSSQP